jgi:hypothetical protein
MNYPTKKQWYIKTEKGIMKVSKDIPVKRAMHMAARNCISSGMTELYDEQRLIVYVFSKGKIRMSREKVASSNIDTVRAIKSVTAKETGVPQL